MTSHVEGELDQREARRRIFLGPREISGFYANLERGLCELGQDARLVTLGTPHPFGYEQRQSNPWPARLDASLRRRGTPRALQLPATGILRLVTLFWATFKFDVFVFGFGASFLPGNMDMMLLKLLGKRQVVHLGHGSEARPPAVDSLGDRRDYNAEDVQHIRRATRKRRRAVRRVERWADEVIAYPLTDQFLQKPYISSTVIGIPVPKPLAGVLEARDPSRCVIVHAPSSASSKGTASIQLVLREVETSIEGVEVILLQGASNSEVLRALSQADLVVDQLWSDTPLPGLASEAASVGTPSVIGGYGWSDLERYWARSEWPPSFVCEPERVPDLVRQVVLDSERRRSVGEAAKRFVETEWSTKAVSERVLAVVRGDYPPDWKVPRRQTPYSWGAGSSKEAVLALRDRLGEVPHP